MKKILIALVAAAALTALVCLSTIIFSLYMTFAIFLFGPAAGPSVGLLFFVFFVGVLITLGFSDE